MSPYHFTRGIQSNWSIWIYKGIDGEMRERHIGLWGGVKCLFVFWLRGFIASLLRKGLLEDLKVGVDLSDSYLRQWSWLAFISVASRSPWFLLLWLSAVLFASLAKLFYAFHWLTLCSETSPLKSLRIQFRSFSPLI